MSELRLAWRDYNPEDDARWVRDSWVTSYMTSREARAIDRDVYFAMYNPIVVGCMERGKIRICIEEDVPTSIAGWLCTSQDGTLLHYVHVRQRWRGLGVARWMLAGSRECIDAFTHAPQRPSSLWNQVWRYEPWRRLAKREAA